MTRHVFPSLLALLGVLGTLGTVRAQDGDDPKPEEPRPAKTDDGTEAAADGGEAAAPEEPAKPAPPAVGEAFPESLPVRALPRPGADLAEEEGVELASLVGDEPRPVVLLFWSGRCAVCKRYAEVLQKLVTALEDKVAVVLVASGAEETPETVRAALDTAKLRVPVLLDTERKAAGVLGVRVTPTAFLVDAEGVLRYRGPIDDDRRARSRDARELLRPAIDAVLAGKPVESGDVRPFGSALR